MLRIRQEQLDVFLADESWFVQWYVSSFMPDHLPGFHETFDDQELKEMVTRGRRRAIEQGFDDPPSQVHFVTLMFKIGPTFYQFPGFREITETKGVAGPERIRRYYEEVSEEQAAEAILGAEDRCWGPDLIEEEDK